MDISTRTTTPALRAVLGLALLSVVLLGAVPPGAASPSQPPIHSSAILPFDGVVGGAQLTGVVHVVTKVTQNGPPPIQPTLDVHVTMPASDVSVTGAPACAYLAHGAGKATEEYDDITAPNPPPIVPGFVLTPRGADKTLPADPCTPVLFAIQLNLAFTVDGVLIPEGSTATIFTCDDICPLP